MKTRFVAIVFVVTAISILIGCGGSDKPTERRKPIPKRPSTSASTIRTATASTGTASIIGKITFEGKAPKKWTKSLAEEMAVELSLIHI